jgi:D-3-phosphoglycerate dehydrogenase
VQLEQHITLFRYRDLPGMIGRVGTIFGEHGVNIVSAAVGRQPDEGAGGTDRIAAMAITTDLAVPHEVLEEIVAGDGFEAGRTVSL